MPGSGSNEKHQAVLDRFKNNALGAIRRYKHYAELGRDFSSNSEVVVFYNDTLERIANLEDNKARVNALTAVRKSSLLELITYLNSNDSTSSTNATQVLIDELIATLKNAEQFSIFNPDREQGQDELDAAFSEAIKRLKLKQLVLETRGAIFTEHVLNYLKQKKNVQALLSLLTQLDEPCLSTDKTLVLFHKLLQKLESSIKGKPIDEVCFLLKEKLTKLKDNPDLRETVFQACCDEFSSEADPKVALLQLLNQTSTTIEKKRSDYTKHVDEVIFEFKGNLQVIQAYIEDFFTQYDSISPHKDTDIVEMVSLAAVKNNKLVLDLVRDRLVSDILKGGNETNFRFVSVAAVEGLSVAIRLFPPEYLNEQEARLIKIVVRVIEVVAEKADDYNDVEKMRLIIAIRSMLEGVASSKSLERTQKSTGEYADEVLQFMKTKTPENPFRSFQMFQEWLKKSKQTQIEDVASLATQAVATTTQQKTGIPKEQRTKLGQAVDKLQVLSKNKSRLSEYVYAGIKAEVSNIPIEGEKSSLEQVLTTLWHTAMIAKSVVLIVTSSGALLVQEGVALVDHLIELIPEKGAKSQEWNKYAKDLRGLRVQAAQLSDAEFSKKLLEYCIKLVDSGITNLNLEYEIFRSMKVGLKACEDKATKKEVIRVVSTLLIGKTLEGADKDKRRQQASDMMLDFMTSSDEDIIEEAYRQMEKVQKRHTMALMSCMTNTWGAQHINVIDLKLYSNKRMMGKNENHTELAYEDEVAFKPAVEASALVMRAREARFKFQDTIATLTQEHKRSKKSKEGLYLSVNGHTDPENMNSNEWVNIIGELWKFLEEDEKKLFILHGASGSGKRVMTDHLVDSLLRYRRLGSFYPVRVHLKNLTGGDVLEQALQAEKWPQKRIEALRQRFSVKASSVATKDTADAKLPTILLIVIGVSAENCPPELMQRTENRWGRRFKSMLVVTGSTAFGLKEYANIFSTSLTPNQVQSFFIQPQVTREQIAVALSYDAAMREYRRWRRSKRGLPASIPYVLQETDDEMLEAEDFPEKASDWVKKHYQYVFSQNAWLLDLADTQGKLRMLITMTPKFFAGKRFQGAISREQFLDDFIDQNFRVKLGDLKQDTSIFLSSDKQFQELFMLFSRKAALHILRHKRPLYAYSGKSVIESSAKKQLMETDKVFFDTTNREVNQGFRLSPLVPLPKKQYHFMNLDVWLYFAIDGLYHEIIDCVEGNLDPDSVLNNTLIYAEKNVFYGLLNRIRSDMKAQIALYNIVLATKTNKALDIASSNAMSWLVRVRSFSGNQEMAGTSYSKANLDGGLFDNFCGDDIDMNEASIERCDFNNFSSNRTKMGKVKLREPDSYKVDEVIEDAAFSEDGKVVVLAGETGSVSCYRGKALSEEEAVHFLPGYRNGRFARCKSTNQVLAVAQGWLEVWDVDKKETTAGPVKLDVQHGEVWHLSFCQDGSKILLRYACHALIYALEQLNEPLYTIERGKRWQFKLSFAGTMLACFIRDEGTSQIACHVIDVKTGQVINQVLGSAEDTSSDHYHLVWLTEALLLIQTNNQMTLCEYKGTADKDQILLSKTRTIEASKYEIFEKLKEVVFLCGERLEHVCFGNINASIKTVPAVSDQDTIEGKQQYIFLEDKWVKRIENALSKITIDDGYRVIKRHELASDKKHLMVGVSRGATAYVFVLNLENNVWLSTIEIDLSWLDLAHFNLVTNKLIIYQNWKKAYVFDLDRSMAPPKEYKLHTAVSIDEKAGLMDFVADMPDEQGTRGILLNLNTLQEVPIIPQEAALVSLASNSPLTFTIQRNNAVYQLTMNADEVVQTKEGVKATKKGKTIRAIDGKGLVALPETGGRVRLERQYDDGKPNQVVSRLNNVPDIIALHFIPDNQLDKDDTQELMVVCRDGTITFWPFDSNAEKEGLGLVHDSQIMDAVYSLPYEYTLTLDNNGKLIQWSKTAENQVISLPNHVNRMTLCSAGKYLYLFNESKGIVHKLDLDGLKISKTWPDIQQFCVMQHDGAFIYLTKQGKLFSERAPCANGDLDDVGLHELRNQGKIESIHYLPESDKLLVYVMCNARNGPIKGNKLIIYSDSTFETYEGEYLREHDAHTTHDASLRITRNTKAEFLLYERKKPALKITHAMLPDVDKIHSIKLVEDKVFVHYLDYSLKVWDPVQKKLSHERIENVEAYFVCPNHHLLVVKQGMSLSFYSATRPGKNEAPCLLPAGSGYRDIHEVQGCTWLNEDRFATFQTNYGVKIWQVTQTGCRQMEVLGSRRFNCEGMAGVDMIISEALKTRLNRRGAELEAVEPAASHQSVSQEDMFKMYQVLQEQNQELLKRVNALPFFQMGQQQPGGGILPPVPPATGAVTNVLKIDI